MKILEWYSKVFLGLWLIYQINIIAKGDYDWFFWLAVFCWSSYQIIQYNKIEKHA